MVLFAIKTGSDGRLGVTASRKIGNAVVRARSKRRLRELYRHRRGSEVVASVDLVVNAKRSCGRAPWACLVKDFDLCLERLAERMSIGLR